MHDQTIIKLEKPKYRSHRSHKPVNYTIINVANRSVALVYIHVSTMCASPVCGCSSIRAPMDTHVQVEAHR